MKLLVLFAVLGCSLAANLKDKATKLYVGAALAPDHLSSDSHYKQIAGQEFNCLTPENQMKWNAIETSKGHYNYGPADQLVEFAQQHKMKVRGHTLIWHNRIPSYVQSIHDKKQMEAAIDTHIQNVVGHYKGKIYAWDVVNEILESDGSFRDSVFHKVLGQSYVAQAFKAAHAADPEAKLYINDYGIEGVTKKSDALLKLVKQLRSEGVPIHGVGFQSHFIAGHVPDTLQQNLKRFSDAGFDVAITELDMRIKLPVTNSGVQEQAMSYAQAFKACEAVERCVGVTLWGFTDKYSSVFAGMKEYAHKSVWDENYKAKAAHQAIESALH